MNKIIVWMIAGCFLGSGSALADANEDWSMGLSALSQGKQEEALALLNKAAAQGHVDAKTALRLMTPQPNTGPSGKPIKPKYQLLLTPEPP